MLGRASDNSCSEALVITATTLCAITLFYEKKKTKQRGWRTGDRHEATLGVNAVSTLQTECKILRRCRSGIWILIPIDCRPARRWHGCVTIHLESIVKDLSVIAIFSTSDHNVICFNFDVKSFVQDNSTSLS